MSADLEPTVETSLSLVVPGVGQLVNLDDYKDCASALDGIRDLEQQLREVKAELQRAIGHEAEKQGTKTLELDGGRKAVLSGGREIVYDAEQLEIGLREAGMPESRIREIVELTYTYKVKAVEAKRAAAANPEYEYVVDACRSEIITPVRVSIRRS